METIKERFLKNIKNNKYRGVGETAFTIKNYKFPTHEQMNQYKKFHLPYDIDTGLRDLIIELNQLGYKTLGSCNGHNLHRGFISFALSDNEIHNYLVHDYKRIKKYFQKKMHRLPTKKEYNEWYNKQYKWHNGNQNTKQFNKEEVFKILKKYNLKNLRYIYHRGTFHSITFDPIPLPNRYG
jgi:hypothetical protein